MVIPFPINIGSHPSGKILYTDLVRLRRFLAPVPCCRFAHEIHVDQDIDYGVLNKVEFVAVLDPGLSILILKCLFELIHAPDLGQLLLQICQLRDRSTESLHFIKDAQENIDDGILVLLTAGITLGIDIEKNNICRRLCCQSHICQHHRIHYFLVLYKEIKGMSVIDLFILQKIGQDLQEVGFTASKETGDPYTHFRCCAEDSLLVCRKEISKMFLQFTCHDILFQFLSYVGILSLSDDDDTLNVSVYLLLKHVFYKHLSTSLI